MHRSLPPATGLVNQIVSMGRQLGKTSMLNVRVVAPPARRYRGKQARRAAFYHRRRCARMLQRIVRTVEWSGPDVTDHLRDALVYGMSALKAERVEPRFTIDPRTKDLGSMFHVRKVSLAEFEREFPRHVGVDFAEGFEPPAGA